MCQNSLFVMFFTLSTIPFKVAFPFNPNKLNELSVIYEIVPVLQEFYCILHGALYFLAVPSMSMLLIIYSICNMHVVSWGTRESATAADPNKKPVKKPDNKLQVFDSTSVHIFCFIFVCILKGKRNAG